MVRVHTRRRMVVVAGDPEYEGYRESLHAIASQAVEALLYRTTHRARVARSSPRPAGRFRGTGTALQRSRRRRPVIKQPALHVRSPCNREPLIRYCRRELFDDRTRALLHGGGLLGNPHVFGDSISYRAADPRETEVNRARHVRVESGSTAGCCRTPPRRDCPLTPADARSPTGSGQPTPRREPCHMRSHPRRTRHSPSTPERQVLPGREPQGRGARPPPFSPCSSTATE